MSDPSIHRHLESQSAAVDITSDDQLPKAFTGAFPIDLPPGHAKVNEPVEKLRDSKDPAVLALDPKSEEGKQFAGLALVFGAGLIRVWLRRSSLRPMP